MNFLSIRHSVITIHLVEVSAGREGPLSETLLPYLTMTPHLVLDMKGILLTSSEIGEIVNLAQAYQNKWKEQFRQVALVNLSDHGKKVLEVVKLDKLIHPYSSLDEAYRACIA
ncbi:MAG: STAS domain-containing protein [Deltaproteobacteria bacterium]|nr:STAS domain-containing protein [Deltaproteobacteria bacterium]